MQNEKQYQEWKAQRCMLCMQTFIVPNKSLWQSIKDYWRGWWKRHIVDDYPYGDTM